MDPNLFHLDWERVFEVLVAIVVLSFLIERALSVLFETPFFVNKVDTQGNGIIRKGIKELIAIIVSIIVCIIWEFDAISMVFLKEKVTIFGAAITGGIVAGGSKGSLKLFRDILGFMSSAEKLRQAEFKAKLKKIESGGSS